MSAYGRKRTLASAHFSVTITQTPADLPQPPSYVPRMDDDRVAFEFAYALQQARQVDREAAQMIVQTAEAGLIQIIEATAFLTTMRRHKSKRHLSECCTTYTFRRTVEAQNKNNPTKERDSKPRFPAFSAKLPT